MKGSSSSSRGTIYLNLDITSLNTDCLFANNTAGGGGAFSMGNSVSLMTLNCTFIYNKAIGGGAMLGGTEIVNTNSRFIGNEGGFGGAIYIYRQCTPGLLIYQCISSRLININCTFLNNYATYRGGAIAVMNGANCSNINCNFTQNRGMLNRKQSNAHITLIYF